MTKYKYTTPPGALLSGSLGGCINRPEFNDLPPSAAAIGWAQDSGTPIYVDLATAPHVLIAGTTGSGKSIAMHDIITSLLYKNTPATAEMYMIDPKIVELSIYERVPVVRECITDPAAALAALQRLRRDMMKRYDDMRRHGIRNAASGGYKHIYVFIDEIADLMFTDKRETEKVISSLARLGRAAGIHLIIATQRPTRDVLTGQIKLNIPCRLALAVPAAVDSVTILGHKGAETLTGRGDSLLKRPDNIHCEHVQCAFISDTELNNVIDYCQAQRPARRPWFKKAG